MPKSAKAFRESLKKSGVFYTPKKLAEFMRSFVAKIFWCVHFSCLHLSQFRLSDIVHSVNSMQYQQWSGAVALRRFLS